MARPLRIEHPGALYHLTSRGNARNDIYHDDHDRQNYLSILSEVVKRYNWLCHAYCMMGNHYHLLVETPEANLSSGMRQLNGIYTQRYNRKHKQVGHLFQGRYKAIIVDKENHLLELCRYLVINPVRAKLVDAPEHWQYSSYRATAGLIKPPEFLTIDWVLSMFGLNRQAAQTSYQRFVREGMDEKPPWDDLKGQLILGDADFVKQHRNLLQDKENIKEISRNQRYVGRPHLEEIFADVNELTKSVKNEKIYTAHANYGYTLKEIADLLGIHYATVSRAVRKVGQEM
jgi:putative transposase